MSERLVRNNSAMHGKTWSGKGSYTRVENDIEFKNNHDNINWNDGSKPQPKEVIKKDGKTTYKF